ncbi:hypothetical protein DRN85_09690, partial [Methanosarcinales archaeon]
MNKVYILPVVLLVAFVVCSSVPASAWPSCCGSNVATGPCPGSCGTNGTINGTVYVGGGDYNGEGTAWGENIKTQIFDVPEGTIKWSRLYYHVWGGNSDKGGWVNVTFINATGGSVTHSTYCPNESQTTCSNCSQDESEGHYVGGVATHWLYWNVTEYTTSGYNNATIHTNENHPPDTWDGRIMWIVLVTVVENNTQPRINYTVNQGRTHIDGTTHTTVFYGGVNPNVNHTLYALALASNGRMKIWFNNQLLDDYNAPEYDSIRKFVVNTSVLKTADNNMTWEELGGGSHPVLAVFYEGVDEDLPNLEVEEKVIDHLNGTCYCQTPTAIVSNHTYDVRVKVCNNGENTTGGSFDVRLYDGGVPVQTNTLAELQNGTCAWTTFQWKPTTSGTHTLNVSADPANAIRESNEHDNNKTQNEPVLQNDTEAADLYPRIRVLPAWQSNKTEIVVRMYNNGTTDAGNASNPFIVSATMSNASGVIWTNSSVQTFVCAKTYREITYTPDLDLVNCTDYTVTVVLDTTNTTAESNELNNTTSKTFHAVDVRLKVTHHYGNTSTYNGELSDNNDVAMIDVARVIPNCTTPYDLLNSEADTITGPNAVAPHVYGINSSMNRGTSTWYLNQSGYESATCPPGRSIFWYCFINGVPMPSMPDPMDEYIFDKPGEIMHIDILKYVNSGNNTANFRPRPIMDFPEPFKHGYNGTRWSTIIAYPTGYSAEANAINATLQSYGVSDVITQDITATPLSTAQKANNNLILLGTPTENSIIAEVNANHTEVGMPAYFDASNPNAIRLYDDWLYNDDDPNVPDCCSKKNSGYHSVIMACDNPFDNAAPWTNTWMDADKSVWIASGVTSEYAKQAANTLASGNLGDKGFWYETRICGDVDGDNDPGGPTTGDVFLLLDSIGGVPGRDRNCVNCG